MSKQLFFEEREREISALMYKPFELQLLEAEQEQKQEEEENEERSVQ
jgi:hypothetical protein